MGHYERKRRSVHGGEGKAIIRHTSVLSQECSMNFSFFSTPVNRRHKGLLD